MKYLKISESKKKITLIVIYFFCMSIGTFLLKKTGVTWIQRNMTSVVYGSLFLIVMFFFGKKLIQCIKGIDERGYKYLVIIGLFTLVANVMAGIFLSFLNVSNDNQLALDNMTDHNVLLLKLTIVLFAPVTEELVYRYGIYGLFGKHYFLGCIITTLLFAFNHVWVEVVIKGQWIQLIAMLPYFFFGLGLNVLYQKTKNVIYPIMLHMGINIIAEL